jgi:hypothetical protein
VPPPWRIPLLAIAGIAVHLALGGNGSLIAVLVLGGVPLLAVLAWKLFHGEIGADLLAGISIVTAAILGEYLAGPSSSSCSPAGKRSSGSRSRGRRPCFAPSRRACPRSRIGGAMAGSSRWP